MQSVRLTSLLSTILTALLLVFVFVILVPFRIDSNTNQERYHESHSTYALVVTMHCSDERRPMYLDVLTYIRDTVRWSSDDLFIVDSANSGVPHSLVHSENQVLYDQDLMSINENGPYPTVFEQVALSRFVESLWPRLSRYDYVIKLTGKYKPRGLVGALRKQTGQESCIISSTSNKARFRAGEIHTEIIGFKTGLFREWVSWVQNNMPDSCLESKTDTFARVNSLDLYILPRIKNDARYERNDGTVLQYL